MKKVSEVFAIKKEKGDLALNKKAKIYHDFEPVPFWFYNDNYNEEEIIRQLDCMKENGIKAFFLHVRDGKTVQEAYGTDIFFEEVKFIVERAIERDIKVWLYDEDSYPSGNCGGKIIFNHPELMSYTLKVEKVKAVNGIARKKLGNVKGLYGYIIKKENGIKKVEVLKNCFGPIREHWYHAIENKAYYYDMDDIKYKHYRGETSYARISFETKVPSDAEVYVAYLVPSYTDERFGFQVDSLNKKTAKVFIEYVHENYKKFVGKYFGKEIPGIFFDEPWTGGYYIPYTDELNPYFYKKYGYKIEDNLYKLSKEYEGDYSDFNRDYLIACSDLFNKNFVKPIRAWCKKNNLLLTGHFICEENVIAQAKSGQNFFDNIKEMDIPGFDIICTNLGNLEHPALILGSNIVSSCAAQSGKRKILTECMALSPYNLNYYGEKRIADWLFVNGINMLVPHALYYGFSAFQHTEAGKSFFFQDAYFDDYVKFTRYAGRVCKILQEFNRNNKVLLVLPNYALTRHTLHHNVKEKDNPVYNLNKAIMKFVVEASSKQIGFDTLNATHFDKATIRDGKIKVGKCTYEKVFVVSGEKEEGEIYQSLIEKGVPCEMIENDKPFVLDRCPLIISDEKNLLLYEKTKGKKTLSFIFNNSNEYVKLKVKANKNTFVYDAENDLNLRLKVVSGQAEICLQPFDSIMILDGYKKVLYDGDYAVTCQVEDRHGYLKNPQVFYQPKQARYSIETLNLIIEKDGEKTEYKDLRNCRIRDVFVTMHKIHKDRYFIPFYDNAKEIDDGYPVKATYSTEVQVNKGEYLLFDGGTFSGDYSLVWNGKEIDKKELVSKRVYDVSNLAYYPKEIKDKNLLQIVFDNAEEFSGVNGEIYVCDKD